MIDSLPFIVAVSSPVVLAAASSGPLAVGFALSGLPLSEPLVQALGWTLVHSLWQGLVIAGALALVLRYARLTSQGRYAASCAALLALLAAPLLTFALAQDGGAVMARARALDTSMRAAAGWSLDVLSAGDQARGLRIRATASPGAPSTARPATSALATVTAPSPESGAAAAVLAPTPDGSRVPSAASTSVLAARIDVLDDVRLALERALPTLVALWLCGLALGLARVGGGWWHAARLRRRGIGPLPFEWTDGLAHLARRIGLPRGVTAAASSAVTSPSVIGWLRPLILVPTAALTGLSRAQLEAVLLHELAHIRRHDYLVNLAQAVAETVLFYHPALWFVSHRIRVEREHCCDDLAVEACGDAVAYASALAELERLRLVVAPRLALAATRGPLLRRIERILDGSTAAGRDSAGLVSLALIGGLVAGAVSLASTSASARHAIVSAIVDREAATRPAAAPAAPMAATTGAVPPDSPVARASTLVVPRAGTLPTFDSPAPFAAVSTQPVQAVPPPPPDVPPPTAIDDDDDEWPPTPPAPPEPPAAPEPVEAVPPPPPPVAAVPAVPPVGPMASVPPAPPVPMFWPDSARPPRPPAPVKIGPSPMAPSPAAPPVVAAPPAVAAPAAPPTPPAPPPGWSMHSHQSRGGQIQTDWTQGDRRLIIRGSSDVEPTDDDTSIARLKPGDALDIEERLPSGTGRVEFRGRADGKVETRWFKDGRETPFEPEGRAWLAQRLPDILRRTGLAADARVARILARKGPQGVLAEVSAIPSDYVKRRYLSRLLATATLDAPTTLRLIDQAGQEIRSDFELASLLIDMAKRGLPDNATQRAYVRASTTLQSSFESRRALAALVETGRLPDEVLVALLTRAGTIESDFELATLLMQVSKTQELSDAGAGALIAAATSIDSDFEQRRTMAAMAERPGLAPGALSRLLQSTKSIASDFELATLLLAVVQHQGAAAVAQPAFFEAVATLGSSFEQGRVLLAVVKMPTLPESVVMAVLGSVRSTESAFEAGRVLMALADQQRLSDAARKTYVEVAQGLRSDFERNRVLARMAVTASR